MAMLRWPGPAQQPGATGTHRLLAWSDTSDTAEPWCIACRLPVWSSDQEAQDGDSSVSSGPLSGSSGGHMPCAPPHGPWKERPPLVSALQQLPRKSDPRLERLRDRIRQQAWGQASCASLGTSAPSSTSYLCSTSTLAPRRRTRKVTAALPAPAHPGPRQPREGGGWEGGWARWPHGRCVRCPRPQGLPEASWRLGRVSLLGLNP